MTERSSDVWKPVSEQDAFTRDLLMGYVFKDVVGLVLDQAGYEVYPFGYESFLPAIKTKLYKKETQSSPVLERVRSTPDLLVYDPVGRLVQLLEVKSRISRWNSKYRIQEIDRYRKYWPESIVVLAVPQEPYLCAQRIADLPPGEVFDHELDFTRIEEVFGRIKWGTDRLVSRETCVRLMERLFSAFE